MLHFLVMKKMVGLRNEKLKSMEIGFLQLQLLKPK